MGTGLYCCFVPLNLQRRRLPPPPSFMKMLFFIFKDRKKDGVCLHGMVGCECHYQMYFNGTFWEMTRQGALKYSTKEEAETAAFLLVMRNNDDFGEISVKEFEWESGE